MCVYTRIKKYLITVVLSLISMPVFTQIQSISTHYMYNPQVTNPAFYGGKDGINFGANYRHQWAKLEGQPRTINVFADAALPQIHGGVGFAISSEMLGAFTTTSFSAGYAFIQDVKKKFKIGIGINAGAEFSKLDGTKLITPQGSGGSLNDASLSNQVQKSIRPNLSFGISFIHKFIEAGIAYTNLINAKDKFKGDVKNLRPKYGSVFQTYVTGKIRISDNFSLKPSFVFNTDFKEFQTDFSFLAGYKQYLFVGVNVRGYNKKAFESLSPIVSVSPVKNLSVIYSYDVSLNKLNSVNKGSHEITLNYVLMNNKIYRNPKIINNPRFL
ncbi:MAG: putative rane protein [Bacteroidota bacterium]|nr:putative rane protein [Bacteroidota bacterium]